MVRKVFDYIVADPVFGELEDSGTVPLIMTVLSLSLVFGIIAKLVFDRYSIMIYYVMVMLVGYGAGKTFSYYNEDSEMNLNVSAIIPPYVFKFLIPVFVFTTAHRLDYIKFLGISQFSTVTYAGVLFYLLTFAILLPVMYGVYDLCFDWQIRSLVIMSYAIYLFNPESTIEKIERKAGHIRLLQAILKAEALWSILGALTIADVVSKSKDLPEGKIRIILLGSIQLLGLLVGLIFGILVQFFYKLAYNDHIVSPIIPFPMSILIYSSAELMNTSGCAAVSFYAIFVTVIKKPKITAQDEKYSNELWSVLYFFMLTYMLGTIGFILGAVKRQTDIRMFCMAFGFFIATLMLRFLISYFLLPYLYGSKTDWAEIALIGIGPHRGGFTLLLALRYATEDTDEGYQVLVISVIVVLLSAFLNIVCLDWFLERLNVFALSKPQISNMTTAVEQINKCRSNMIFAEKLDRIVADANWAVVSGITAFSHPYKDRIKSSQFGEGLKEDIKTVECPRCGAWSIAPPTKKELDEITKETKLRVMKALQISFLKQREAGTLTENGYKFLSGLVYQGSMTNDICVKTDDLRINADDLKFVKKCESFFETVYDVTLEKYGWQPTNHIRLRCYNLVTSQKFRIVTAVTSLIDTFLCLTLLYFYLTMLQTYRGTGNWPLVARIFGWIVSVTSPCFYICNVLESTIQILGLGVMQYFSRRVYIIEFFSCIIMRTVQATLFLQECMAAARLLNVLVCSPVVVYLYCLMFLRVTRLYIFVVSVIPYILARIKRTIDEDLLRRYDIGKAYLVGLDRVLKYLNRLTSNEQILEEIKKDVESNRQIVTKELGVIQKEHPTIAITVKTKHAIKHVINSMNDCMVGLQTEGILDSIEYNAFVRSLGVVQSKLHLLKVIVPASPINIMKEIPWLVGDEENTELFLNEAQMSNYDYNDILIRNGDDPVGLYILMSGLLKAQYVPSPTSVQLAVKFGVLPNYDFFENFKFDQPQEDYIVSGNVVGEYGVVTGRRYDMNVLAETAVQVYYIPWNILKDLHETSSGQHLLDKIWKKVAIKISVTLLQFTNNYRHWSDEKLLVFLNRGSLPNLTGIVAVKVDQRVEEAILVEGVAMDLNDQKIIYGPYRIPKTVTKLLLPEHRAWDFQTVYNTKLFIVPTVGGIVSELLESHEEQRYTTANELDGAEDFLGRGSRKNLDKSRKVGFTAETDY